MKLVVSPEGLAAAGVNGWLVADYRGSNPVFEHLIGRRMFLTRRAFLLITEDAPRLLISRVDARARDADAVDGTVDTYLSWADLDAWLALHVRPLGSVAMEYSPRGALPAMSRVDGGTLDLVRDLGVTVRPSADLFQLVAGAWSEESLRSHRAAMRHVAEVKDLCFVYVGDRLRSGGSCTERAVQDLILREFGERGLEVDDPPVVASNAHSGDPHYEPSDDHDTSICAGDWLLIDLWAKERGDEAVFADITWVGYVGSTVPPEQQEVFDAVAAARDAVVGSLRARAGAATPILGCELDDVARHVIADAGYGDAFVHRTGHSLSPGGSVHGLGANLDNLETHDTRAIVPRSGFTIEPGIYLPEFGVRLEINVYMTDLGPEVTSPTQESPVLVEV